jgi:hypothetical protein
MAPTRSLRPLAVENRSDFRYEERPRSGILKKFRPLPARRRPTLENRSDFRYL